MEEERLYLKIIPVESKSYLDLGFYRGDPADGIIERQVPGMLKNASSPGTAWGPLPSASVAPASV
jgi:hypothetical protein